MPKKMGVNSKAEASRARKGAEEAERKEREAREKEERYWKESEGPKSRAAKKREDETEKRAEAAARKAETRKLAEMEQQELERAMRKPDKKAGRVSIPVSKVTEADLERRREEERLRLQRETEAAKKRRSRTTEQEEYERMVLVSNTNLDDSLIEAHTVEEAIAKMSLTEPVLPADRHPERRLKASFKAFEEAELPKLKEEKPGLTLTQYKDMIWKLWQRSPDNPLNTQVDCKRERILMANRTVLPKGHSIHRPPLFDGSNYSCWKNHMTVFLRSHDYEVWKVIEKGPYMLPDDEDTWSIEQIKQSPINYNAMNIMLCAIHPNEYSRVSMCTSAKEMWDKFKLIYEGTSQVKEIKANLLVHEYELFKMKPDESIFEMFARLTEITDGLKGLGREYSNAELVRKVLRSLPPTWHTKATVIEKSKDLSTLSFEELINSLMTYEINIKRTEEDLKKKKNIALKANKVCISSSEGDDSEDEDEEEFAMLTRQVRKFLQRKKKFQGNNQKKSSRKGNFGKA